MKRSLVVLLNVSADKKYPDPKARLLALKFMSTSSPPSLSKIEICGVMPLGTAWPKSTSASDVTSWQSLVGIKRNDHASAHELCKGILQRSNFFARSVAKLVSVGWIYVYQNNDWTCVRMTIELGPNLVHFLKPDELVIVENDRDKDSILSSVEFANPTEYSKGKAHFFIPPLCIRFASKIPEKIVYIPDKDSFQKLVKILQRVMSSVDPSILAVANRTGTLALSLSLFFFYDVHAHTHTQTHHHHHHHHRQNMRNERIQMKMIL